MSLTPPPTPRCPRCRQDPEWLLGGGAQAFCGNPHCTVMTWNPNHTVAEFEATATPIRLTRDE
jgi:hypothetical protein